MTNLPVGQLVLLVGTDGYMPPMGTIGKVVSGPDWMDDYDVIFNGHPCPVPPDESWSAHRTWLVPIDADKMKSQQQAEADTVKEPT